MKGSHIARNIDMEYRKRREYLERHKKMAPDGTTIKNKTFNNKNGITTPGNKKETK